MTSKRITKWSESLKNITVVFLDLKLILEQLCLFRNDVQVRFSKMMVHGRGCGAIFGWFLNPFVKCCLCRFLSFLRTVESKNVSKTFLKVIKSILWCIKMNCFSMFEKSFFGEKKNFRRNFYLPQDLIFAILSKKWSNTPLWEARMTSGVYDMVLKMFSSCSATSGWPTNILLGCKSQHWWTDQPRCMSWAFFPPKVRFLK